MITFKANMDPHALDVVRDADPSNPHDWERVIALLHWHPGHEPRMVVTRHFSSITLDELVEIVAKLKEVSGARAAP